MKYKTLIAALIVAVAPPVVQAAGNAAAGKAKAAVCTACHGADGMAMIPTYPNLAGQNVQYLELAMKAYKSGQRSGGQAAIMAGMAAPLSDADIADLAAYFNSL